MACGSCGTKDGKPGGCKNNGTCGTDGCNNLTVFDWLANMKLPAGQDEFNFVEVRFKNGRKQYYKNTENLSLYMGDTVAVNVPGKTGYDIGQVTLTGELVRTQMRKKRIKENVEEPLLVLRKATEMDITKWRQLQDLEENMKVRARESAIRLKLKMKISDIEYQGDGSKVTIYYTADARVDFRELIREYARMFNARIEMKQIGLRQEASRLGGIGSCGRELCCSTWLTDFRSVSTGAARYQQLSLNPEKLAGQCGKLKCCLNYELDSYMDALKSFPKTDQKVFTEKGKAVCQKVDIFKGMMWYAYEGDWMNWIPMKSTDVMEIVEKNKKREPVASLEEYAMEIVAAPKVEFENAMGQDSLTRFDQPKRRNNRRKKGRNDRNRGRNRERNASSTESKDQSATTTEEKPRRNKRRRPQRDGDKARQGRTSKRDNKPKESREQPQGDKPRNKRVNTRRGDNKEGGDQKPRNPRNRNRNRGSKPGGDKPNTPDA